MTTRLPIRRALVSVFDKRGLDRLAAALAAAGVEVVSTGSTAAALEGHGLAVTRVEELTGFPELLDGRVKTLHPRVHAGLLADRSQPGHQAELDEAGIAPFDLVVVNLYPFQETVAAPDVDPALAIERIDIGGPAMVRAAAKNHAWVTVICDPADYPLAETALAAGGTTPSERRALAAKAFARTAAYDTAVAAWMAAGPGSVFPERLGVSGRLRQTLRYGENPHQGAAFYAADGPDGPGAGRGQAAGRQGAVLQQPARRRRRPGPGRRARRAAVRDHRQAHQPVRGGVRGDPRGGLRRRAGGRPESAFGGVVGLSRPLDAATAKRVAGIFTEVVVAPGFDDDALAVLAGKPSLRLVEVDPARPAGWLGVRSVGRRPAGPGARPGCRRPGRLGPPDRRPPGPELLADLALAWSVAAHVKSNAIVLARDGRIVGVGAGQQSRVDSVRIAVAKAGERARGRPPAATPSSPSPTASRPWPRPASWPWPSPAAASATPRSPRRRRRPGWSCSTPAAATSATDRGRFGQRPGPTGTGPRCPW